MTPRRKTSPPPFATPGARRCKNSSINTQQSEDGNMSYAIRIHEQGGPENMKWEEVAGGAPGPGELRIRHTAIGLNYIDTYHRSGLYKLPMPTVLGRQGAGVVEAVGPNVTAFNAADHVAYAASPIGSYSEERLMPAERVVQVPANVTDHQAASRRLKGMTAHYLIRRTHRV